MSVYSEHVLFQSFFLAHGPAFKEGYVAPGFDNIQIYNLLCCKCTALQQIVHFYVVSTVLQQYMLISTAVSQFITVRLDCIYMTYNNANL